MLITPAIKGQITKAIKNAQVSDMTNQPQHIFARVRSVFAKYMPNEQAKHATKKYLAAATA